jgi:hypothetical protein
MYSRPGSTVAQSLDSIWYVDERKKDRESDAAQEVSRCFCVRYRGVDSIRLRPLVQVIEVVLECVHAMGHGREREYN